MVDLWRTLDSLGKVAGLGGRGEKEGKGECKEGSREDEDEATSEGALEILTEMIHTILRLVSIDHPPRGIGVFCGHCISLHRGIQQHCARAGIGQDISLHRIRSGDVCYQYRGRGGFGPISAD